MRNSHSGWPTWSVCFGVVHPYICTLHSEPGGHGDILLCCKFLSFLFVYFTDSPNCPTINTTVDSSYIFDCLDTENTNDVATWPVHEWYSVKVLSCNESIGIKVYNSTLQGSTSFHTTSLDPGTVHNISVIPCNMAGCNESCDIHSVQKKSEQILGGGRWLNPPKFATKWRSSALHLKHNIGQFGARTAVYSYLFTKLLI